MYTILNGLLTSKSRSTFRANKSKGPRSRWQVQHLEARETPATFTVTNTSDGPVTAAGQLPGSLRQAIFDANAAAGADTIVFDAGGLFATPQTITLSAGELKVADTLTITGTGASKLTVSGGSASRVFNLDNGVAGGPVTTITGLTVSGGAVTGSGGGFTLNDETLVLDGVAVKNNTATVNGAGINVQGNGTLTIRNSTLSGNVATGDGGAVYFFAGGKLDLINSTVSSNSGKLGGGVYLYSTLATISNSTVAFNTGTTGGGIVRFSGNTVTVQSSIVSNNTAATGPDISGKIDSVATSIVTSAAGATFTTGTPTVGDPLLGGLMNNGGPTETHSIPAGSPAKNAGSNPLGLPFDQRGFPFSRNSGTGPDAGAFEIQELAVPAITNGPPPGGDLSFPYSFSYAFTGTPAPAFAVQSGALPPGLTLSPAGTISGTPTQLGTFTGVVRATNSQGFAEQAFSIAIVTPSTVVSNTNDSGSGSLRQALVVANTLAGVDTITFDPAVFTSAKTITLTSGELKVTDSVVIQGPGADKLTVSGNNASRVFNVSDGKVGTAIDVTLGGLTVSGGKAADGAGIFAADEKLTVLDAAVTGNVATGNGGGIAVTDTGVLVVERSEVSGNTAGAAGGGVALFNGPTGYFKGSATVRNTTVSGNTATGNGGGVGGFVFQGTLNVQNSTVTLNKSSAAGGGVRVTAVGYNTVNVVSSVVSGNTNTAGTSPDFQAYAVYADNSFVGVTDGITNGVTGANNFLGTKAAPLDAGLLALANNGGPTRTHALPVGSKLLNAGSNPLNLATDQRGTGFARTAAGGVDIGAFEDQNPTPVVPAITGTPPDAVVGLPYNFTFTVTGFPFPNSVTLTGTLPSGLTYDPATFTVSGTPDGANGLTTFPITLSATNPAGTGTFNTSILARNAATVVTNTNDAGPGSLRQVVLENNGVAGPATVTFDPAVFGTPQTITLTSGEIKITDSLVVNGLGADKVTVSGNSKSRIFNVDDGNAATVQTVTVRGLTLTGGTAAGGGAITVNGEILTVEASALKGNTSTGVGGAIATAGAAKLFVRSSTLSGNKAGGGLGGGAIFSNSYLGKYQTAVTVANSTVANNTSVSFAGGIGVNLGQKLELFNSTVTGNTGAGTGKGGGILATYKTVVVSSIVSGNTAPSGNDIADYFGKGVLADFSLIGDQTGLTVTGTGNLPAGTSPGFDGGLKNNGGPTETFALLGTSAAKDAGSNPTGLLTDQRLTPNSRTAGAATDIGAFEIQTPTPPALAGTPPVALQGAPYSFSFQVSGSPVPTLNLAANPPLPPGLTFDPLTGTLSGTPTTAGTFGPYTLTATNASGTANLQFSVTVRPPTTVVTSELDSGPGTLREAISDANLLPGASTITFAPSLSGKAIVLASELKVTDSVAIEGLGADKLTVSGNNAVRVFNVNDGKAGAIDVSVSKLTVTGGKATGPGGGFFVQNENLTISASSVSGNTATASGGGVYFYAGGKLTVTDSLISGNSSTGGLGGGGLYGYGTKISVVNTTVTGNTGSYGGGITNNGGGATVVSNSTIAFNAATTGGGGIAPTGPLTITSTIIAKNSDAKGKPDVFPLAAVTGDNNIIGVVEGFTVTGTGNQTGTAAAPFDPLLLTLAANGGPTQTIGLGAGSPALNAGSNPLGLAFDQRGTGFNRSAAGGVDVGAFEDQNPAPTPPLFTNGPPPALGIVGAPYSFDYNATGFPSVTFTVTAGALPDGLTLDAATGLLSGTPTAAGTFNFTVTASNGVNPPATQAATITVRPPTLVVTSGADAGPGTLREALSDTGLIPGAQTITFDPAVTNITLATELKVTDSVVIRGPGADKLTVSGGDVTRVFNVDDGKAGAIDVTIGGMKVTGGNGNATLDGGGINVLDESLKLDGVWLTGNKTTQDGGGVNVQGNGKLVVLNSAITGNTADSAGGGVYFFSGGQLVVTNSTISGNTATTSTGGGVYLFGTTAAISNSTIAANTSKGNGGGVVSLAGAAITLTSTIVADNTSAATGNDISGTVTTVTTSLVENTAGATFTTGTPLTGDPALDALTTALGGTTPYHPLKAGSIALDVGSNPLGLVTDQRGLPNSRVAGPAADIGAFEVFVATPPSIVNPGPLTAINTAAFTLNLSFGGAPVPTFNYTGLPAGLTFDPATGVVTGTPNDTPGTFTVTVTATNASGTDTETFDILLRDPTTVVTSEADSGPGTLREAVADANLLPGAQTITFAPAMAGKAILLATELVLTDSVTIQGLGADQSTVSGNKVTRLFTVYDGKPAAIDVTISGLTLTGGNSGVGAGGAVLSIGENLTIESSVLTGNTAKASGGAVYAYYGKLVVSNSTLSGNTATGGLGGGAIFGGGADITVVNSTVVNNKGNTYAGGIGSNFAGPVTISNSTIAFNEAGTKIGGGILATGTITLNSTIVAQNKAGGGKADIADFFANGVTGDNNLVGDADGLTFAGKNNLTGTKAAPLDPQFDPAGLAANGGPTPTLALLPTSPAIDAGSNPLALATDQRGTGFVRVAGKAADIGAFELQAKAAFTSPDTTTFVVGTNGTFTVTTTGFPAATLTQTGLPAFVTFAANPDGTATITGTPPAGAGGTFAVTFTADNGLGTPATQSFTLVVNEAPAVTGPATLPGGITGFAYTATTVTATGFPAPAFTATGLPAGLTISPAGVISGTPTAAGTFNVTVTASNGVGTDATRSFVLQIDQAAAPTLTGTPPAATEVNVPFNFAFTATGTPQPVVTATGLPAGLTINPAGVISGTPTATGTFNVTVTATNGVNPPATQSFTLTVFQAPAVTSAAAATFQTGVGTTTFQVTATGSPAPAVTVAGLPAGLTFDPAAGVISGTPTASGVFAATVTADNGFGTPATQTLTVTVNDAPAITSPPGVTFTQGVAGTFTVTAAGFPVPTLSAANVPAGLAFDPATGVLSGTPAAAGTFTVTVTAANGVGTAATQDLVVTVNPAGTAPAITTAALPDGVVGLGFDFTVVATGTPPPAFTATGLPAGLAISPAGRITGTPTAAGTFNVTVTASNGVAPDASEAFTLTVASAGVAPTITSAASATATVGSAFTFAVTATGTPAPTVAVTGLPAGLAFDPATGLITGTPTASGTFSVAVTAGNGVTPDATQTLVLTVNPQTPTGTAPAITSAATANGTVGSAFTFAVTATGNPTPTLTVTGLPAGLAFDPATGLVTGTPTTAGTFSATVTATNGVTPDATQTLVVTIADVAAQPPEITTDALPNGRQGTPYSFTLTATGDTPVTFTATGLPAGLTLSSTGVITGTPTRVGTVQVTVTATNAAGSDTETLTLEIDFPLGFELLTVSGPPSGAASTFGFDAKGKATPVTGGNNFTPFPGTSGDVRAASADVDGDGVTDRIYASGPGVGAGDLLRVISGATGKDLLAGGPFNAYAGENFTNIGMFVQAGDIDGDGKAEIVVSPDQGGGARVQVFSFSGGKLSQVANFFGIEDPNFRGGGRIGLGDVDGDGRMDLAVGAGFTGGPRIALFDGNGLTTPGGTPPKLTGDFFVFEQSLRNGTWVSVGDLNADGFADLIFGGGPGGGPRVFALSGKSVLASGGAAATPVANFFAFASSERGGVRVSAKDVDGDDRLDIVAGSGEGSATAVNTYLSTSLNDGTTPAVFQSFDPFGLGSLANGVYVG